MSLVATAGAASLGSSTSTTALSPNSIILKGVGQGLEAAWPLFAAGGAFLVVVVLVGAVMTVRRTRRLARSGIGEIDRMDGRTFEERLAVLFRQLGYKVDLVGRTGDFGADLVVAREGVRCAVQAKQRSRGTVGIKAVQEVVGSLPHHRCQRGLVVTNQRFTIAARQLAREHNVQLWERDVLIDQLLRAKGQTVEAGRPPM
jgi:restriction system protein